MAVLQGLEKKVLEKSRWLCWGGAEEEGEGVARAAYPHPNPPSLLETAGKWVLERTRLN